MTEIGLFLSAEEHDGTALVQFARQADEAGIRRVWVSDHFHPWIGSQGQSPFVWCVIGGIAATTELAVTTAVTCPTFRMHPAIVAHAAATAARMLPGRFVLGVGSGEALNEHVLGQHWPPPPVRIEMLAEAIEVMRELWTGKLVTWRGEHYTVEGARLYTRPDGDIPIHVSALGPKAMDLAVSHGDGWVTSEHDDGLLARFRAEGRGPASIGVKVCWGPDEAAARRLAHRLWPNSLVAGPLNVELPQPSHFEAATEDVTEDQVAEVIACGPDPERHMALLQPLLEAGYDEVYISQIGPDQAGFLDFFRNELAPRLGVG